MTASRTDAARLQSGFDPLAAYRIAEDALRHVMGEGDYAEFSVSRGPDGSMFYNAAVDFRPLGEGPTLAAAVAAAMAQEAGK